MCTCGEVAAEKTTQTKHANALERNVAHRRVVTKVGALAIAMVVHVPQLDLCVRAARQKQMPKLGEELDGLVHHIVA